MKQRLLILCLCTLSLSAMEDGGSVVFVGENRPLIPMRRILSFRALHEKLIAAGHITKPESKDLWIYGTNDAVFSPAEKDALWIVNNIKNKQASQLSFSYYPTQEGVTPTQIAHEDLWHVARYLHQWNEYSQQKISACIIMQLMPSLCSLLPQGNNWIKSSTYNRIKKLDDGFADCTSDGSIYWHNHYLSSQQPFCFRCHESMYEVLPSLAHRYCALDHTNDTNAFTEDHVQQFCNKNAVHDIALNHTFESIKLTIIFADKTQAQFEKENRQGLSSSYYMDIKPPKWNLCTK